MNLIFLIPDTVIYHNIPYLGLAIDYVIPSYVSGCEAQDVIEEIKHGYIRITWLG